MAVPVRAELFAQLDELGARARHCLSRRADRSRERFDEVAGRLPRSLGARAGAARADLNLVAGRLRRELLDQRVSRLTEQLSAVWRVAQLAHPDKPLERGFARVTARDGRTLIHARDAREAKALTLHFGDGEVAATVDGADQPPAPPVERKQRKSYIAPQPGLFDAREE
jgi:exodeoxyribonuclease VII large subunit